MVHLYLDRLDAAVMPHPVIFFCVEAPISSKISQMLHSSPFFLFLYPQFLGIADEVLDHRLREHGDVQLV